MSGVVFLNGRFIPEQEARLSVISPGFLYGWGLFESMRSVRGKFIYLEEHLDRLCASCKVLKITLPYSKGKLKSIIRQAVSRNKFKDTYARLTLWKSDSRADILVTAKEYQALPKNKYHKGFSLYVSSFRRDENSPFANLKTTNYLSFLLAYREAKNKSFDDALLLDSRGYLSETSRANIFLVKDETIFTPGKDCGCLAGVTRGAVFDLAQEYKVEIYEGKLAINDLLNADEAFLTNSLVGVMPVVGIGNMMIGDNRCGKLTKWLQEKYNSLFS